MVRRLLPEPDDPIEIGADDSRRRLDALYAVERHRWLRLNLVTDVAGSAAGPDGTSETLSNRADRAILGAVRRASDVVLVGAQSVRAERYQLPRTVPLAVVTSSGDLSGHRVAVQDSARLIVLCPASAATRARQTAGAAQIVPVRDVQGSISPSDLVDTLVARGMGRIVCEGGPRLAGQLVGAGLVDELCLTTSPTLSDVALPALASTPPDAAPLQLRQLLADDTGALYARWSLSRAEADAASP